jgi:hypothetical protein
VRVNRIERRRSARKSLDHAITIWLGQFDKIASQWREMATDGDLG